MSALFAQPLAIVDLETTGADPHRDRITEIAILRIEDGRLAARWSSLIDPGIPIPPRIQAFTGITDDMVARAPAFGTVADEISERLAGAVFVAHNARFDFGFLRAAFAALGQVFDPAVLCTVKFSRALSPEHARHGLDAIVAREGYIITDRHRALTDADIVWRFLQDAVARHPAERIDHALAKARSSGRTVPTLPAGDLEALPEAPGVFVFLDGADNLLHLGHTAHLRSKVLGSFTGRPDARLARIVPRVKRVEVVQTAGALDAQLIELKLARSFQSDRHPAGALAWHFAPDRQPVLEARELAGTDPAHWQHLYGAFRGTREADNSLRELMRLHRLCPLRIGLERGNGPCQAYGLQRCDGVCIGREAAAAHDARLLQALKHLRVRDWPWPGPVAVQEANPASERAALHLFDRWCLLGSAHDEAAADALLADPPPRRFDAEIYRLLARWLVQPGHADTVRPLPSTGDT